MIHVISFILLNFVQAVDYYEVLGLDIECTDGDIKKAFRKLSRKFHPDKNLGDPEAEAKYYEVVKAHDVLSDITKRQVYDIYGIAGLKDPQRSNKRKGQDSKFGVGVTLEDLYMGTEKAMTIQRNELCPKCRGTGAKDRKTEVCKKCSGKGTTLQTVKNNWGQNMKMQMQCERCGGTGFTVPAKCPHCNGKKVFRTDVILNVLVEKGLENNAEIPFPGEGGRDPDFFPGDIIFYLSTSPHPRFTRNRTQLNTTVNLTFKESLVGYQKDIIHLDGHVVRIEHDGPTQPGSTRRIKGEGMPDAIDWTVYGDLIVTFEVEIPRTLSQNQKQVILTHFGS